MPTHPLSPREAREQAAECLGFMASQPIQIGDEVFEVPHPSLLDDDQQNRYDELQLSLENLDRWPDVTDEDGSVLRQGELKDPHRTKDGKLVELITSELGQRLYENISNGSINGSHSHPESNFESKHDGAAAAAPGAGGREPRQRKPRLPAIRSLDTRL